MNLSSFVNKNMVTVSLRASTKRAVIAEIVGYICSRLSLPNKNQILQSVLEREEKASTGIGDGVAIPHSRLPHLEQVLFFVGISKPGIDFGAPDGKAAHIIFLFVTPEAESQTHLKILSAIGNLQKNTVLLDKLMDAASDSDLFNTLNYEQVQRESYFPLSRDEVFRELETSEAGLSEYEARARSEIYGQNRLSIIGATPLIGRFLRNLVDLSNLPLWAAAAVGFLFGFAGVAWAVAALAVINAGFAFLREYKGERAVDALKNLIPPSSKVIRAGHERRIATENLVPGDILLLDKGDVIPADGRLIDTSELRVDNSAFSGDQKPVYKSHDPVLNREQFLWIEMPALVFAGTTVMAGNGTAVVTATGMDTELGQVAYLTQTIKDESSGIQRGINRFARVSAVATLIALALGALLLLAAHGPQAFRSSQGIVGVVAAGIILGLSAEGLIPAVTFVLISSASRLRRKGALIKRLSSIGELGMTDVICTDKTGTLTTSEMCVKRLWLGGRVFEVGGEGYRPHGEFRDGLETIAGVDLGNGDYRVFFYDAALCNNATLEPPDADNDKWHVTGDPTEGALLSLVEKAEIEVKTIRQTYPAVRRFPFDSVRKRMSTVHALGTSADGKALYQLFAKGAPHELLRLSTKVLMDGRERPIDQVLQDTIDRQIDKFAEEGMRVLGFAYRRLPHKTVERGTVEEAERDLVFTGMTAMFDPPRDDAHDAIRTCREAGVRVIMITGEYQLTALSIARQLGIVEDPDARVISGKEISESTDEDIRKALETDEIVFARVNPEHRLRIVNILKQTGRLVAATGDGISDAPVLKKAHIGVAMGERGSPVTRATAEIVLSADSFASIVSAIEEGRTAVSNIRRMIEHIASHLLPETTAFVAFLVFSLPLPLSLALVLLLDLVIDLIPSLAIGTTPPSSEAMSSPPSPGGHHIVARSILTHGFLMRGLLVSVVAGAAFILALTATGSGQVQRAFDLRPGTIFFAGIAAAQLALFVSRMGRMFSSSRNRVRLMTTLVIAFLFTAGLLALTVYLPELEHIFRTASFAAIDWIEVGAVFAVVYVVSEVSGLIAGKWAAAHSESAGSEIS